MKAPTQFRTPSVQFYCLAWLTAVLSLVFLPHASAEISFVDADGDFSTTMDSDSDSDGLTYVVGRLGSQTLKNGFLDPEEPYAVNSGSSRDTSNATVVLSTSATIIKKYDTSGVLESWDPEKPNLTHLVIPELDSPIGIHLAANGSIYLVGSHLNGSRKAKVLRLNQRSGLRTHVNADFTSDVSVSDITYNGKNDKVYITGIYNPDSTVARIGDIRDYDGTGMGSRAVFVTRMSPGLTPNHHSYFGANGGWTLSNSITSDETGAVYIAGRYGAGGTVNGFLQPADAFGSGRAFVIKYDNAHRGVKEYHGNTATSGYPPSAPNLFDLMQFRELHYSQGWVYVIGDQGSDLDRNIAVVKLDTELKHNAVASVESDANLVGRSITSDEAGNVYVSGRYGPGSADFIDPADSDDETEFTVSTSKQAVFVAKLKPNF